MQRHDVSNNLVKLELVDLMQLDPMPDRAMQGRLTRMLKQVGAKGTISIRARMITTVSNTKYKTQDGQPISLVGLHGKDELLVRGPDWAIEEVGRGRTPDTEKYIDLLLRHERTLADFASLLEGSGKSENRFDEIGNALRAAGKIDSQAKSALKQEIAELLAELAELRKLAESGNVPWWYFWSTWWTDQTDRFRLRIDEHYYFRMT